MHIPDITRCSHYITYGYNKEDLKKTYPQKVFNIPTYEFGSTKEVDKRGKKRIIDILYPIINTISILEGGMIREKPDRIVEKQLKLLGYLDLLDKYSVVIKPFFHSNYENLAVFSLLEKLKNAEVIYELFFIDALKLFNPRCVLIDHPSTVLYEILSYDCEIFLLGDSVRPIEESALKELKRRVHYSEDVDEIISKIYLFLKGKLEKKMDNTFYNHYVHKNNTKENILKLIDNIIKN